MKDIFTPPKTDMNGDKPTADEAIAARSSIPDDNRLPPKDRKSRKAPIIDGLGAGLLTGDSVEVLGHPGRFAVVGHDIGEGRILVFTKTDVGNHFFSVSVASVRKVVAR